MDKRIGFVGIIICDRRKSAPRINEILSEHGEMILARMGLPHEADDHSIITLIVRATTDGLGALTGKIGALEGVSVKSGLAPEPNCPVGK